MSSENLKQQTKTAILWNTLSHFVNQGLQFVIGIILARLLSPSDYGIVALPMIFLAVAQCFIDSGFSSALIRKPELTEEDLSTAFYFNIIVGISFYTLLFFTSPLIADFYNVPILADILKVTALSTLFSPLQSVHFTLFAKNLNFSITSKISILCKITTGIVGILLAYLGAGIWAIVFQGVAGQLLSLLLVWHYSPWRPTARWSNESFSYLFGFGGKLLWSSILDTLYNNINPLIIGKFYSPGDLGMYNRAMNYATLPHNHICGIINSVSYPVLSKLQDQEEELNNYFRKMIRLIIFVLSPAELLLAALARPLIIVMITEKWEPCVPLLQLLCFSVMLWPIQSLNMSFFRVKDHPELVLKSNVYIKVFGLFTKVISLPLGMIAICIGNLVHAIISIIWIANYAGKVSQFSASKQLKEMASPMMLSITMFIIVVILCRFIPSLYCQIIIGGIVGIVFYISAARFLNFNELEEVLYLLNIKKNRHIL